MQKKFFLVLLVSSVGVAASGLEERHVQFDKSVMNEWQQRVHIKSQKPKKPSKMKIETYQLRLPSKEEIEASEMDYPEWDDVVTRGYYLSWKKSEQKKEEARQCLTKAFFGNRILYSKYQELLALIEEGQVNNTVEVRIRANVKPFFAWHYISMQDRSARMMADRIAMLSGSGTVLKLFWTAMSKEVRNGRA